MFSQFSGVEAVFVSHHCLPVDPSLLKFSFTQFFVVLSVTLESKIHKIGQNYCESDLRFENKTKNSLNKSAALLSVRVFMGLELHWSPNRQKSKL